MYEVCRNYGVESVCSEQLYDYNNTDHCAGNLKPEVRDEILEKLTELNTKQKKLGYGENVTIYGGENWWDPSKPAECSGK